MSQPPSIRDMMNRIDETNQFEASVMEDDAKRVMVKGRDVYIDRIKVGEVGGGRYRHRGQITPDSGFYLRFPNNERMYMNPGNDRFPAKGSFAYAKDLIQQIGLDADEILARAQQNSNQ